MKIKHAVNVGEDEVTSLFDIAKDASLKVYATPEEQAQALMAAKADFALLLDTYTQKAFKMGKKIGKIRADKSDSVIYQ